MCGATCMLWLATDSAVGLDAHVRVAHAWGTSCHKSNTKIITWFTKWYDFGFITMLPGLGRMVILPRYLTSLFVW